MTKEAVFSVESGKNAEYELLQLKFDAKPGDTWTANLPGHFADGAKITARDPATVEFPAGKHA